MICGSNNDNMHKLGSFLKERKKIGFITWFIKENTIRQNMYICMYPGYICLAGWLDGWLDVYVTA